MKWDVIESNWKQFQGRVKRKWGRLTDYDLDRIAGKRDRLCGQIQETYDITKDQADRWLRAFEKTQDDFQPESRA